MKATKTRKPVKPASGTYRWVRPLDAFGVGVLTINGTSYTVETLQGGYRLTNQLKGKVYDIDTTQTLGRGALDLFQGVVSLRFEDQVEQASTLEPDEENVVIIEVSFSALAAYRRICE
jgi:hypothetical protein